MLPRPTLRKIIRETIITDGDEDRRDGLEIPPSKQLNWLEQLALQLSDIDRVEARVKDFYIALRVLPTEGVRRDVEWFMVNFFPYDSLQVKTNRTGLWLADATYKRRRKEETEVPVREVEQITDFVEAIKAKQDRAKLRDKRNDKIAGLKQKSLKARLTELAEEHNFSFALGESKRDVNLSIRVGGKKTAYHIAFPKGKLDAVLDQVPDFVRMLEDLRKLGVTFRTNNKLWVDRQEPWFEPKQSKA